MKSTTGSEAANSNFQIPNSKSILKYNKDVFRFSILTLYLLLTTYYLSTAQIAINTDGTAPDASAMLDVSSTDKGMLIPRMTTAERENISSPATGLMVYDSDENSFWYYNGTAWTAVGNNIFVSENGNTHTVNDDNDFIVGADSVNWVSGSLERKLFFNKSKGAFRVGGVFGEHWNEDNTGSYSFSSGFNNTASGYNSVVFGQYNTASGSSSVVWGANNIAPSYGETVFGTFNTEYTPIGDVGFVSSDRLFVIGNGQGSAQRSDAMIIYKNGNTLFKGQTFITDTLATATDAAPETSAILDIASTDKGVLIPRMDSTARTAITSPAEGLMVYDNSTATFWYYDNDQWNEIRNGSEALSTTDMFENLTNTPDFSCLETKATLSFGSDQRAIAISDNYAYVVDSDDDNLSVVDISNPTSPAVINSLAISSEPSRIAISGNYAYIISTGSDDLKVIDISNPNTLSVIGSLNIGTTPRDISISGNYAYIVDSGSDDLKVIDISTPSTPTQITSLSIGNAKAIKLQGNYAYFITGYKIEIIDISVPNAPSISGSLALGSGGELADLGISGNHAYVVDGNGYEFYAVDISDPTTPTLVDELDNGGGTGGIILAVSDNYAYVETDGNSNDFRVIDISNPTALTTAGRLNIGVNSTDYIVVSGGYAYISTNGNLKVINIACDANIAFNPISGTFTTNDNNLADHSANQNIQLNDYYLSNDGDDEGISISDDGNITLSNTLTVSDDFLAGTNDMSYGGSGDEAKVIFDKSQFAFRTGRANNTNWDEANLGLYSFASGTNTLATGNNSVAFGYQSLASGTHALAGGNQSEATGHLSLAFGREVFAPSYGEVALGLYSTTYTPDDATDFDTDDRLFVIGNGSASNSRSNAMAIYKNGNTEINGQITTSAEAQGTDYVFTIKNTTNDNSALNNALEILAGHDTYNSSENSGFIRFSTPNGTTCGRVYQSGSNSVSRANTSDIRLKENILPTQYGLSDILNIKVRDYNFKLDPVDNVKTGFLAQQLYEVFPTAVLVGGEDAKTNPWMVDYSKLTPLLVKGIQDQQKVIESQENRIQKLENENQAMKIEISKIQQLEQQNAEMKAMLEQIQQQLKNQ